MPTESYLLLFFLSKSQNVKGQEVDKEHPSLIQRKNKDTLAQGERN